MALSKIQSESINLADNFAFTGTVTGAGGVNTPAFEAYLGSDQTVSDNVYTKVPISECLQNTGKRPIKVRWVIVNKGDKERPEYRARLVAKEIKMDQRKSRGTQIEPKGTQTELKKMQMDLNGVNTDPNGLKQI